ncbi:MAG: hypothetical protein ACRYG7_54690 [Janthinobacterium lividum]
MTTSSPYSTARQEQTTADLTAGAGESAVEVADKLNGQGENEADATQRGTAIRKGEGQTTVAKAKKLQLRKSCAEKNVGAVSRAKSKMT